jgi:16S rRNA (guanine527-N7)-methyltransferase
MAAARDQRVGRDPVSLDDAGQFPLDRWRQLLASAALPSLQDEQTKQFIDYFTLIIRWNARMNLTSVRSGDAILSRHFIESIACAHALPRGIRTLLDFGSGAGFPGIPIAICRPEIRVRLAESQSKKAAFLLEAVRVLGIEAQVHSGRAETLSTCFDCVTLRAVDRMEQAVREAVRLIHPGGWLALMTTTADLDRLRAGAGSGLTWQDPVHLPGGDERVLSLAVLSPV